MKEQAMSGKIVGRGEYNHWLGANGELQHTSYFQLSDKSFWAVMPGLDPTCVPLKVQGLNGKLCFIL